jgi:hypothetical protein
MADGTPGRSVAQGRVDYLERLVTANLSKISTAMATFRRWAQKEGLNPSESAYLSRSRDHRLAILEER